MNIPTEKEIFDNVRKEYNKFRKENQELNNFLLNNPDIEGMTYQILALHSIEIAKLYEDLQKLEKELINESK